METTAPSAFIIKSKKLKSNLNGKLCADIFCHLQVAGFNGIPEHALKNTRYRWTVEDNSHPGKLTEIIDSVHQPLRELSAVLTYLSHGMRADDFISKVLREVPNTTLDTPMVAYFYRTVPE